MNAPPRVFEPDANEISRFVGALFRYADDGGYVSLRAFDQFERKPPILVRSVRINGAGLEPVVVQAVAAARESDNARAPAVFAPPICTLSTPRRARGEDLENGLTLSVEIDEGNTIAARRKLEDLLGPATVVVASGSDWKDSDTGEVFPKLHLHWRVSEPTRDAEDHARLRQARNLAGHLVGADPTGKPVVHPLRWPGSWNRKAAPRQARILALDDGAEIHLAEALEKLEEAVAAAGLASAGLPRSGTPEAPIPLVAAAMQAIPNAGVDVHYDDWIRLGYACHRATGGGGDGFSIWDEWSRQSDKYNAGETEATWKRIRSAIDGSAARITVGAGTIFWHAQRHGWKRPDASTEPKDNASEKPEEEAAGENEAPGASAWQDGNGWPEPLDFLADAELTGAPELRRDHLPEAIGTFVFDTAARMGVDPAAVALAALVSLASVIDDDWRIQPKANDDTWTENPRIWGAIVGDPSMLKSPIIRVTTAPIDKMEAEARERYEHAMRRYRCELKAWKDAGSDPENEPKHPRLDRYMVEGTTTEALTEALRDDCQALQRAPAGKVLIRQDEMSEWVASFDRYRSGGRGGADRGAYLRLYNGGRHTIDRVNRGAFAVPNWSACILGGIQPGPIRQIAKDAADDGLLQRFCYCVPARQSRGEDRRPDGEAMARYAALFPALAALHPASGFGAGHRAVVLHAEAHSHRLAVLDLAEALAAMPDASDRLKSALGKWAGLWARMVLVFHLIGGADAKLRGADAACVVANVAKGAAATVTAYMQDILLPHLLRAEAVMFATEQTGHARWIAGFILAHGDSRIAARDIMRSYRALRAPESRLEMLDTMASLEAMGWVRPEPTKDHRSPVAWQVNPKVHSLFADRARRAKAERQAASARVRETLARRMKRAGR